MGTAMNPTARAYLAKMKRDGRLRPGGATRTFTTGPRKRARRRDRLAYDGVRRNRQTDDWIVTAAQPPELTTQHLALLQRRSRDLARNAPPFISAIQAIADKVIEPSNGVKVRPKAHEEGDIDKHLDGVNQELRMIWQDMAESFDVDARESAAMVFRTIVREWIEVGEAFAMEIIDPDLDDRPVPITWKIVPAERVDHTYNRDAGKTADGKRINKIRNGIEFDEKNRRVAYHITDIEESGVLAMTRTRVPASQIRHVYHKVRAGQERGLPWLYGAILLSHDLDDLIDDELTSAHVQTMLTAFIKRKDVNEFPTDQERDDDTDSPVLRFEAGAILDIGAEDDVQLADPNRPGGNFVPFASFIMRCIAKTLGVTYETISGDYSKTNFASGRLAQLPERETIRRIQADLIQLFVRPAWKSIVRLAVLTSKVSIRVTDYIGSPSRFTRAKYVAKGFDYHDVLKEGTAAGIRIALGVSTVERECEALYGEDWEDIARQRGREIRTFQAEGVPIALMGAANVIGGGGDGTTNQDEVVDGDDGTNTETDEERDARRAEREAVDGMSYEDFQKFANAYGVAVRSGSISPCKEDEDFFRKALGLPAATSPIGDAWDAEPVRRPVTLAATKDAASVNPVDEQGVTTEVDDAETDQAEGVTSNGVGATE